MSDQIICTSDDGKKLVFRRVNYGAPNQTFKLAVIGPDGQCEFETEAFSNVQLSALAHAFSGAYFQQTKRVVWPAGGAMLHLYEKEKGDAEAAHLKLLEAGNPDAAANYAARLRDHQEPIQEKPLTWDDL